VFSFLSFILQHVDAALKDRNYGEAVRLIAERGSVPDAVSR
jgi:hypothetical protein